MSSSSSQEWKAQEPYISCPDCDTKRGSMCSDHWMNYYEPLVSERSTPPAVPEAQGGPWKVEGNIPLEALEERDRTQRRR